MRRMIVSMAVGGALFAAVAHPARAGELKPQTLESRVTSVALFKNGLAFATRVATLPRGGARLRLEGLPVPVHGTFWAWTPGRPTGVQRLVASLEPVTTRTPTRSLGEYLLANVGRDVEVVFNDGKTAKGRVLEAPGMLMKPTDDSERLASAQVPLRLATSDGVLAFDATSMQRVQVNGAPPVTEVERRVPRATLDLEAAGGADARLELVYLSRGATWAPSYVVELMGKDRARVSAKAEIINELEDWTGAELKLVTGYPNIAFSAVDDPMAMRGDLAAFLAALGSGGAGPVWASGAMRQNIGLDQLREERSYSTAPPAGERVDELFLYPLPAFSLPRGQRAYVPLFSVDAAAEHLYELNLSDRVRDNRFDSQAGGEAQPLEIWHRVRLTNSGTVPWTTAPALAMRGGAIVAQDELPYAAPGGTSTLRITRVGDLHADADEFEIGRKPRALEVYGRVYDEITLRGVAEIASFRDEDVTLTVTKNLTGAVLSSTPVAKVDRSAQRLAAVNPTSTIRWTLPLKAHSSVKLEYRYTVYIQI